MLQTISTPIHILGFDYYNKPESNVYQRLAMLKREYVKSTAARMLRMTPAYGIGGVINLKLMQSFRKSQGIKEWETKFDWNLLVCYYIYSFNRKLEI